MTSMMMVEMMRSGDHVMMQLKFQSMEGHKVGMEMGVGLVEVEAQLLEEEGAQRLERMGI